MIIVMYIYMLNDIRTCCTLKTLTTLLVKIHTFEVINMKIMKQITELVL